MLLLEQASTYAADLDFLVDLIFWLVTFWFLLTEGVFFWLILSNRRSKGAKAEYIDEGPVKKPITWAHSLVLICDVFIIFFAVQVWYQIKQDLPPSDATVRLVAQQWAWSFVHPGPDGKLDTADDIKTVDTLFLEVDKLYHYKLESRDVLHNFSVPVFRLKQDAIPGRTITGWFQPTKAGEYDIQCAEICGIGHGIMGARVKVQTPEQHTAWMNEHAGTQALQLADAR